MKKYLKIALVFLLLCLGAACIPREITVSQTMGGINIVNFAPWKGKAIGIPFIKIIPLGLWRIEYHGKVIHEMMWDFGSPVWIKNYFKDGSLKGEQYFKENQPIGTWTTYFENGQPQMTIKFEEKKKNVPQKFERKIYDSSGNLVFNENETEIMLDKIYITNPPEAAEEEYLDPKILIEQLRLPKPKT